MNISALMNEAQIGYRKLHFSDFMQELAPRPASNAQKITLPEHFVSLFPEDCTLAVSSVSGKKYSFWHALLSIVLPDFMSMAWCTRKATIDRFMEQLSVVAHSFCKNNSIMSRTTINEDSIRYRDCIPDSILRFYLCCLFDINIIIVDNIGLTFSFWEPVFNKNKPAIVLYQDDAPIFYPISINGETLLADNMLDARYLLAEAPKDNTILQTCITKPSSGATEAELAFYGLVHKLTNADLHEIKNKPLLNKLKVRELQELAKKYGISLMRATTEGKLRPKIKEELMTDILLETSGAQSIAA